MNESICDIKRASELTGLAVQTLYNLRNKGDGPKSFSLRGRVRYYEADIRAWIEEASSGANVIPIARTA